MDEQQKADAQARQAATEASMAADDAKLKELEEAGTLEAVLEAELGSGDKPSVTGDESVESKAQPVSPQEPEAKEPDGDAKAEVEKDTAEDFTRKSKGKGAKRLLAQRNQARKEVEEERRKNAELQEKLKAQEERRSNVEDDKDENPDVRDIVNEVLSEREAEQSDWDELFRRHPEAKGSEKAVQSAMEKHPTLSPTGAYRMLNFSEKGGQASGDSGIEVGGRMSPSQFAEKDMSKSSTSEMEAYLRQEDRAGRLA